MHEQLYFCAFFNVSEIVNSTVNFFLGGFVSGLGEIAEKLIVKIMATGNSMLDDSIVVAVINNFKKLALSILIVKVLIELGNMYIINRGEYKDKTPDFMITRVIMAIFFIASSDWFVKAGFELTIKINNEVANIYTTGGSSGGNVLKNGIDAIVRYNTANIVMTLTIIAILIAIIVVAVQTIIRSAQFVLLSMVGSFMAINYTTDDKSVWSLWLKQIIAMMATQILQLTMISIVLSTINLGGIYTIFKTLGLLVVIVSTPKFLQPFVHTTGVKGGMSSATQTIKHLGVSALTRKVV